MSDKNSAQNIIKSYRKRQQMGPYLILGLAGLLVLVGIIILVVWFSGPNRPALALFASRTPTSTATLQPTATVPSPTASTTPTQTNTPAPSATLTPSGPFQYTVQEKDTCYDIALKFKVDLNVLLALNNFGSACPIKPGDKIYIPGPDTQLPTVTPIPTNFRGNINYTVQTNDTLSIIAAKFNSTVAAIQQRNSLKTDAIQVGQILVVPVNIATPVPTVGATSTSFPPLLLTLTAQSASQTAAAGSAATATLTPTP
jgi:LysM repeat protein